jgi:hypothetical protein
MDNGVFPELTTKRKQSKVLSDFSGQRGERALGLGHEVDDALFELANSRQGEIERLDPANQPFKCTDSMSG